MEEDENRFDPERDVGQGERDSDPQIEKARRRAEAAGGTGIPRRTDMPDFTSGPGYTGEVPPEIDTQEGANWDAGGSEGS